MSENYVVFGNHRWSRNAFDRVISKYPGAWYYFTEMRHGILKSIKPRYIFFMHWSDKVPNPVVNSYECIGFHMTDLPFGRGGSPLQNLILRGVKKTKLTTFKITSEIDAGPVYYKEPMSLEGTAGEIYEKVAWMSAAMIKRIITYNPAPAPQTGKVVLFHRRNPGDSLIPEMSSVNEINDFIRMLDADDYPNAYIDWKGFRYKFFHTSGCDGKSMFALVEIKKTKEK